jgi:hypothetical protein
MTVDTQPAPSRHVTDVRHDICHLTCCYDRNTALCGMDVTDTPVGSPDDPVCITCDMTDCPYLCPPLPVD